MPRVILLVLLVYSLFHSVGFVSHTVKYISHTVVFVSHSVKQRICLGVLKKMLRVKVFMGRGKAKNCAKGLFPTGRMMIIV